MMNIVRLEEAVKRSGIKRSKLYVLAHRNPGLFKKLDGATLVDLGKLQSILSELPAAEFKRPSSDAIA